MVVAGSAFAVACLWGVGAGLLVWAAFQRLASRAIARVERFGLTTPGIHEDATPRDARGAVRAMGRRLESRWPGLAAGAQSQLETVGLGGRITAAELIGVKALAGVIGTFLALSVLPYLWPLFPVVMVALGVFGWSVPTLWLSGLRERRALQVQNSITSVMDMLALTLEAGMGLERAIRLVCDHVDSTLTEELRRVLTDIDLGLSRREAFERMRRRVGIDEIQNLTAAIVQSDDLGASLVTTMRAQAHEARLLRRRRAEAAALRAPVKMTIVMGLFTLPALFIILLGPIAFQFVIGMGGR